MIELNFSLNLSLAKYLENNPLDSYEKTFWYDHGDHNCRTVVSISFICLSKMSPNNSKQRFNKN